MKILFLDVDGVLNCAPYFKTAETPRNTKTFAQGIPPFEPYRVLLVHRICEATGARVVVSSSWRLHEEALEQVKAMLGDLYLDKTIRLARHEDRHAEIREWLGSSMQPGMDPIKYAILDDDLCAGEGHGDNFFKTEWEGDGLNDEIAARVTAHLS